MHGLPTINQLNKNAVDHAEANRILSEASANPKPDPFEAIANEAINRVLAGKENGA